MLTIVETSAFARRAEKLLSAEEHDELIFSLALHPKAGDEIPGTGGVRKVRFAARGKGKSGGVRVIAIRKSSKRRAGSAVTYCYFNCPLTTVPV